MPVGEYDPIKQGILEVARIMAISAKTAPKAKGVDNVEVKIIHDRRELELLASKMEELSKTYGDFMARDAKNVRDSDVVVLIGAKVVKYEIPTPPSYKVDISTYLSIINLGIAVGSAVKIASMMNVDNRIMLSIGIAAQELKMLDADFILGVPLSARAKNIYFDRKWP